MDFAAISLSIFMAKQIIITQTPNRNIVIACLHHTFCKHECFIGKHQNQYSSFGVHNISCIETNFQCKEHTIFASKWNVILLNGKYVRFNPKQIYKRENHQFKTTRCWYSHGVFHGFPRFLWGYYFGTKTTWMTITTTTKQEGFFFLN